MSRFGYQVDVKARTVRGPTAGPFHLDNLIVDGLNLFYARSIPADSTITYQETWLISEQDWAITRFTFHEHLRSGSIVWKMEPDLISIEAPIWQVADGYLDLDVYEGSHYELEDADELAGALTSGVISSGDVARVLEALDALCRELHRNHYSGGAILERFAPSLVHQTPL